MRCLFAFVKTHAHITRILERNVAYKVHIHSIQNPFIYERWCIITTVSHSHWHQHELRCCPLARCGRPHHTNAPRAIPALVRSLGQYVIRIRCSIWGIDECFMHCTQLRPYSDVSITAIRPSMSATSSNWHVSRLYAVQFIGVSCNACSCVCVQYTCTRMQYRETRTHIVYRQQLSALDIYQ